MKVLIIFEETDERPIKAIVDMTSKDYEFFKDAGDYFINISEHDAHNEIVVETIGSALSNKTPAEHELYFLSEHEKKWHGKFSNSVIDGVSDTENVDKLISCGKSNIAAFDW